MAEPAPAPVRRYGTLVLMPSSNPALNESVFEREIQRAGAGVGSYSGSPRDELPPHLFAGGYAAAPPDSTSTLPPPPPPPASSMPPPVGSIPQAPDEVSPWPPAGAPPIDRPFPTMRVGGVFSA